MSNSTIQLHNVSKFYGEVLGVNKVSLELSPGITSLVGPNGSGKTTLMNLLTGLIKPTQGHISVLGMSPFDAEDMFDTVAYCTQYDSFPRGMTGFQFISTFLQLHGLPDEECERRTKEAIQKVGLEEAAHRKVDAYSKGMRQRIKLAQALAHNPRVLILDEPLNGLDPMARAEVIDLFREFANQDLFVIISSHILHEVDMISDQVIMVNQGYVVAEGQIHDVRTEMEEHPIQFKVRCKKPRQLALRLLALEHVVEIAIHPDQKGLSLRSRDSELFYSDFNQLMADGEFDLELMGPSDENVNAVYEYLIGTSGGSV